MIHFATYCLVWHTLGRGGGGWHGACVNSVMVWPGDRGWPCECAVAFIGTLLYCTRDWLWKGSACIRLSLCVGRLDASSRPTHSLIPPNHKRRPSLMRGENMHRSHNVEADSSNHQPELDGDDAFDLPDPEQDANETRAKMVRRRLGDEQHTLL